MSIERSAQTGGEPAWFKSSYSTGSGGECVEIAAGPAVVYVRDSKDKTGPVLAFNFEEWSSFVRFAAECAS